MKYSESNKDRELRKWFEKDFSNAQLRRINVKTGSIRGVSNLDIPINFPITAIAGRNGSGKSTVLALACCAYHNYKTGFKASNRKQTYYTYADFFIQHSEEVSPEGITIEYDIAHNNWNLSAWNKEKIKIGTQERRKNQGGKWSDYSSRVDRNCVFIGIERIVPHSEKSQSKSYKRRFSESKENGWEVRVKDIVGKILNKTYDEFKIVSHSKYRLPIAKTDNICFSGFNMGAGENALFEIFSTIFSCPPGALFVIDEIELGLHAAAQRQVIEELKKICIERRMQVICTTHSKEVFECLPDDARFYLEKVNQRTVAKPGASSSYAFSKLSLQNTAEVHVLVEDDVAQNLITSILPTKIRSRVNIEIIGSATALCVQLAALHNRAKNDHTIAVFDGDQRAKESKNITFSHKTSERSDPSFQEWFQEKVAYFPGDQWPERWILEKNLLAIDSLSKIANTDSDQLSDILKNGLSAGKHNEFYNIAKAMGTTREQAIFICCSNIQQSFAHEFSNIIDKIKFKLT
ncbi:ATP-dependent nuclease [Pseudomonas putida]|uniref:ATP-dependent nuclease n=1 Tax=Pseudomonas putida TaxID=303 RepID=UPI002777693B|nr:AAA family ATPase [Pseudomonas putida]MDP9523311.1 AAA family ATPase [Pseudomonas putida]